MFQGVEVAAGAGETQEQLFHPALVEAPGQFCLFRALQQGIDHRRRLQGGGQRLEDAVPGERIYRHGGVPYS
ncbi:hypothetical protein D3C85_1588330 [compost metagenome]